jgi:inorganic pyrophosphatase
VPNLKDISLGKDAPDIVNAIIEIPKGSRNKIEYDVELEVFKLDRVLFSAVHYPVAYGFVPSTLWDDGDPLDILVYSDQPLQTGILVEAIPIGGLEMHDDKGSDLKLIAVAAFDQSVNHVRDLEALQEWRKIEIEHFFDTYKLLEGKRVNIGEWINADQAKASIHKANEAYKKAKQDAAAVKA